MKILPKLVFEKILDYSSLKDVENLKKGLENSQYQGLLNQRLERKNQQPFLCHLCFANQEWLKMKKLVIDPTFNQPECWTGLIKEEKWNENGIKLKTINLESLAMMDEDMTEMNGFQRRGKQKFMNFMFGLQNNQQKLSAHKAALQDILKNTELFYGLNALISHIEANHSNKKNLLDLYEAILDTHNFKLDCGDIRQNLDPNSFIGIHRYETFLSIGNAYVMDDTSLFPLNRHLSLKPTEIPLAALRDLLEKTIEGYEQMILFKPPYDAESSFNDEYFRERMRIKHFKFDLALIQNCKVLLDLIIPYQF